MKYKDIRFLLHTILFIGCYSLLHAQVPANVPASGLVAWYPFSGNADDQSGNHHDGKMYFTQFAQDRNGVANQAVAFNGVNAWIDSNIDTLQARALTISCWFTTDNFTQEYQGLVVARNLTSGGTGLYLFNGQDYIQQITNCTFDEKLAFRDSVYYTRKWHHFAATFDGIFMRNYVDGNLVSEDSIAMDLCIQQSFHIGRDACCPKSYFQGLIDDVGIWSRALSADEIRNLWLPAPPAASCLPDYLPQKGLVAFWPFCGNAQDESGNGHHGTAGNNLYVEDRNGVTNAALSFDGVDDYVEVPHHPALNAFPMTVSFWMKVKPGAKTGKILDKYCCSDWNGWNIEIISNMGSTGGEMHFEYLRGTCLGIFQTYCSSVPYPKFQAFNNQWHLFTFTLDSTQAIVYFDGKPAFTQQWIGGPSAITNSLPLNIGRYGTGNFAYLQGELDDIGIWSRALSASEVADLYYGDQPGYCSASDVLNPKKTYNTVADIDGNVYPTIQIGSQEWMAQNLRTTRFNDGTPIKSFPDAANWSVSNYPFLTAYGLDTTLLCPYGALYNGYTATDPKNVCPTDWHVPTDQDWSLLVNTLGGPANALGSLKVPGTDYWVAPNSGATNSSGFSAIPGGLVSPDGSFQYFGWDALYWTSTSTSAQQAYYRGLRQSTSGSVIRWSDDKRFGFSIRCVRDRCIPVVLNLTAQVCANEFPYVLGSQSYPGPGVYTDTLAGNVCDTIRILSITSLPLQTTTVTKEVCANEFPYTLNGNTYPIPGTYIDTLGGTGCDVVQVLVLISVPLDTISLDLEICPNLFPYTFAGQVLTGPGTYYDAISGPGCDTIRVINVVALPSDNASAIQVTTLPVTGITFTSAQGGGVVAGNGCAPVTLKGIVWSTSPNPTIALMSKTVNGSGFGSFAAQISPLQPNTLYYVRAYATNNAGVVYGNTITFTTPATPGPELTLYMDTLTAFSGSQVVVPVKVKNFQQLISAQFTIKFNASVLTFAGIEQFGLDSLGLGSFGLNQVSNGIIGFAWSQPNLQPASRPDGHVIFALRFTVTGPGGSFSAVRFDDEPVVIEFVNGSYTLVNPYHLHPGRVEVLQDLTMSGTLRTETGSGVRSATVTVSNTTLTTGQQTPLNGQFSFLLPPTQSYTLAPAKNNDTIVTNGVTTFDGLLIQRHVVGIQNLSSPYKIIAGDVNRSGFLSVADIHLINNLVLGNITSYPNGPLWTFVPSDYVFPNVLQPFPYPTTRTYSNFTGAANQDFIGLKLGDVNNSYNPGVARQASSGKVAFTVTSAEEKEGSRIKVPVKVSQFTEIAAFQFSIQWDANVLRYSGIEDRGGILALNTGETLATKGQLNVNWIHPESLGATLADGEVLFYLIFDVIGDAGISSSVTLFSSMTTPIEVVTEELALLDVEVDKGTITVSAPSGTEDHKMQGFSVEVVPNPFAGQARIRINSSESRRLRLEVLDLSGRRLASEDLQVESGWQIRTLQYQFGQGVTILQVTDKDDARVQVRVKLVSID